MKKKTYIATVVKKFQGQYGYMAKLSDGNELPIRPYSLDLQEKQKITGFIEEGFFNINKI